MSDRSEARTVSKEHGRERSSPNHAGIDGTDGDDVENASGRCRASVPVLSVVLLAGTTVVLAATVAGAGFALEDATSTEPTPTVTFSVSASNDRIALVHRGGEPLEVEALTLRISVDGEELTRQPNVPFFSQRGFRPGPKGPFNTASDGTWTVGERASLRVAESNDPSLEPGATVEIRIVSDGGELARLSTTVTE